MHIFLCLISLVYCRLHERRAFRVFSRLQVKHLGSRLSADTKRRLHCRLYVCVSVQRHWQLKSSKSQLPLSCPPCHRSVETVRALIWFSVYVCICVCVCLKLFVVHADVRLFCYFFSHQPCHRSVEAIRACSGCWSEMNKCTSSCVLFHERTAVFMKDEPFVSSVSKG